MEERPRYRNGILVYTAKDIHDDVAGGMDPDCLFVGLEKFDAIRTELARVKADWEVAAQQGHPSPCTLGSLCPYCEIDRLRAVSLRVVNDGCAVTAFRLDGNDKFILHDGETYYRSGEAFICTNNRIVGRIEDDTIVQPVRLERWEDEG